MEQGQNNYVRINKGKYLTFMNYLYGITGMKKIERDKETIFKINGSEIICSEENGLIKIVLPKAIKFARDNEKDKLLKRWIKNIIQEK